MKLNIRHWFFASLLILPRTQVLAQTALPTDSLLQLVREAYIYGFPTEQVYRMYVTLPDNTGQTQHIFNHFSYADKLASASADNKTKIDVYKKTRNRGGAGPNNDTHILAACLT